MSTAPQHTRPTIDDYLARERTAIDKHEYRDGEILLMAGGTVNHSLIIANTIAALHSRLQGKPCNVFDSNLRVRIPPTILYTYPDVSVICGPRNFDPNDPAGETVTNPKLIVEVLSPTTEAYDRGEKFDRYRKLDSLEEYVLISTNSPRIETFWRQPASLAAERLWLFSAVSELPSTAKLRSLALELPLAEIYRGIEFTPSPGA